MLCCLNALPSSLEASRGGLRRWDGAAWGKDVRCVCRRCGGRGALHVQTLGRVGFMEKGSVGVGVGVAAVEFLKARLIS